MEQVERPLGELVLPTLQLKKGKGQSKQLEARIQYLWKSAHELIRTSSSYEAAHQMTAQILRTAKSNKLVLPSSVLDYLCEKCGGLLIPEVTCHIKMVPRANASKKTQKKTVQHRNILRITCHRCQHCTIRSGAPKLAKSSKIPVSKKRKREEVSPDSAEPKKVVRVEPKPSPPTVQSHQPVKDSIFKKEAAPRKLLDDSKGRKKKKKKTDAAAPAGLGSFLQSLNKK